MRWMCWVVALVLAGCGGRARPGATATSAPTRTAAAAPVTSSPWSVPEQRQREPLACPASSSRAGWPSRVLALGDGTFAKLWGRRPRLADVTAGGRLLGLAELGARRPVEARALACGRRGMLAAAWVEYRGAAVFALRIATRSRSAGIAAARTVDTVRSPYDDPGVGDVVLAYAPGGKLFVAYSVFREVRGVLVSSSGAVGRPFTLGPASEITQVAAQVSERGWIVVAWTTIDAGEERNERRRIYAAIREPKASVFGRARLVERARFLNPYAYTNDPAAALRLAVAPNGRALLTWGVDRGSDIDAGFSVRVAEAAPRDRFTSAHQLAADGAPGDVAIRSDGAAVAAFVSAGQLRARVHAPGTRFGAPELVDGDRTQSPTASFDASGRPHLEWDTPSGTRASTRAAP